MLTVQKYSMPIKTSGDGVPLFCLHGEPLKIAMKISADRPVYGICYAYYHYKRSEMPASISEYADMYLEEIRAIQPEGPYFLCGYSVGGLIAYEVAKKLLAEGEVIGELTLVEPTAIAGTQRIGEAYSRMPGSIITLDMLLHFIRAMPISIWERTKKFFRLTATRLYLTLDRRIPQNLRLSGLLLAIRPIMKDYEYSPIDASANLIYMNIGEEPLAAWRVFWKDRFRLGANIYSVTEAFTHLQLMEEPALSHTINVLDRSVEKL
jgi:pimeloyl-ACP methyl ester carboxylesterase